MNYRFALAALCACNSLLTNAQFAPPAGQAGTTAMYKDSSAFVGWATGCSVKRGYQDISNQSMGYASTGDTSLALGPAGANGVLSLGDGGSAVLTFASALKDDAGPDFAVFENSFDGQFLELAFVEVSSDGIHFFRIPATSNTDTTVQTGSFGNTDATQIDNLAGKYAALYGTPFDIADAPNDALLDKQAVTHVKLIDVVGSIEPQYATRDRYNHIVNDPWPTAFASGGFDLDAVGVIHRQPVATGINELQAINVSANPNPFSDMVQLSWQQPGMATVTLHSCNGELVYESTSASGSIDINTSRLAPGVYILTLQTGNALVQRKLVRY